MAYGDDLIGQAGRACEVIQSLAEHYDYTAPIQNKVFMGELRKCQSLHVARDEINTFKHSIDCFARTELCGDNHDRCGTMVEPANMVPMLEDFIECIDKSKSAIDHWTGKTLHWEMVDKGTLRSDELPYGYIQESMVQFPAQNPGDFVGVEQGLFNMHLEFRLLYVALSEVAHLCRVAQEGSNERLSMLHTLLRAELMMSGFQPLVSAKLGLYRQFMDVDTQKYVLCGELEGLLKKVLTHEPNVTNWPDGTFRIVRDATLDLARFDYRSYSIEDIKRHMKMLEDMYDAIERGWAEHEVSDLIKQKSLPTMESWQERSV